MKTNKITLRHLLNAEHVQFHTDVRTFNAIIAKYNAIINIRRGRGKTEVEEELDNTQTQGGSND